MRSASTRRCGSLLRLFPFPHGKGEGLAPHRSPPSRVILATLYVSLFHWRSTAAIHKLILHCGGLGYAKAQLRLPSWGTMARNHRTRISSLALAAAGILALSIRIAAAEPAAKEKAQGLWVGGYQYISEFQGKALKKSGTPSA